MNPTRHWRLEAGLALIALLFDAARAAETVAPLPDHRQTRAAFAALDTTDNAAINLAEWHAATDTLFESTDRNRDGFIDRVEMVPSALMREVFPSVDDGRDGLLSFGEFRELRERIFRAADIDRNGYVTFVEYEILVILRRTGWRDRDRDGRIEMSELTAVLIRAFTQLDANRDDRLAGEELASVAPRHRATMDPKESGRVSLRAWINGYRFLLGVDVANRNIEPRGMPQPR